MARRVDAIGAAVEVTPTTAARRVNAIGAMVEVTDPTPTRRVNAIGVLIEVIDAPQRGEIIEVCAPEVNSAHRDAPVAMLGGPEILTDTITPYAPTMDISGPAVSGAEAPAESAPATDSSGPMLSGEIPPAQAAASSNAGPAVSGDAGDPQSAATTDSAGPMLSGEITEQESPATPNAGATLSGETSVQAADATDNAGPAVLGEIAPAEAPATDSSGPTLLAEVVTPESPATDNSGPTLSGEVPTTEAPTTDNAGPAQSGEAVVQEAAATPNAGPAQSGETTTPEAASTPNSGPMLQGETTETPAAATANAGPMESGNTPESTADATANSGPMLSGESTTPAASVTNNSGPMLFAETEPQPASSILAGGPDVGLSNVDSSHTPVVATPQTAARIDVARLAGKYSTQGISLQIYKPTIGAGTYDPEGLFVRSVENVVSGWSHVIAADGGYKTASLTINDSRVNLDDWLQYGLGRTVIAYNEANLRIWEGFVNTVEVRIGPLVFVRGPLMEVTNRLIVQYSPLDQTIDPPVTGDTTETPAGENTESQAKWGILEGIISAGTITDDDAARYRDTQLYEFAYPQQSKDISIGGTEASVTLGLLGFGAFMGKYIYTNSSINFTTISDKIKAVLQACPNALFSDLNHIQDNPYAVAEGEETRNRTAENIIGGLGELGDASDIRWTFGIYQFRRPYFQQESTTFDYFQALSDPNQRILDAQDTWIRPWNIVPGKWLFISDILNSASRISTPRQEPRAMYIEEVTYTAPWGLQLRGTGGGGNLKQYLAKLSLKGK